VALAQHASILNPSGLPLPRYASLKSDEINMRVGPGKRYPIKWVYKRAGLPVQIIEEFAHWRKIRDHEGASGWIHKGLLSGKRTAIILEKKQNFYLKPDATARITFRAGKGVIANVHECLPDWCEVKVQDYWGWIRKSDIWGVSRVEIFDH
jgi:SH3-like domain-containing protein